MSKKTICLVTDWYPTTENPYAGVFFKEQAFAMEEEYDFLILRFVERKQMQVKQKYELFKCNEERNTVEYSFIVNVPKLKAGADFLSAAKNKISNGKSAGDSKRLEYISAVVKEAIDKHFKDAFDYLYCVDAQREAYVLEIIAEHTGKPYVVGEHAPFPWPGTVIDEPAKHAIENADALIAISYDKIRQMLLQNIKLPPFFYVGNMIDETKYEIKQNENGKEKTLLIVAAHSFYKNYDMFVAVMDRLTEITDVPFKVMIVGYASNKGYSEGTEEFEEQIKNSKFADRAELIREVAHENIGEIYKKADAFVMTSIQEGQPVSAMEAACAGLPVFSTRCGGVEDYIDDTTGRIFNVVDVEEFATGLKDYLEGKINFDSQVIRDNVVKRFGKEAFVSNFKAVFDSADNKK